MPRDELDRLNVYGLIELYVHTVTTFGHAFLVSDLALNMDHRGVKKWLDTNIHHDSHISAIDTALRRDWSASLYALHMKWLYRAGKERDTSKTGLQSVLLGACAIDLLHSIPQVRLSLKEFIGILTNIFRSSTTGLLKPHNSHYLLSIQRELWRVQSGLRTRKSNEDIQQGDQILS